MMRYTSPVSALALALLVAACGGQQEAPANDTAETTTPETAPAEALPATSEDPAPVETATAPSATPSAPSAPAAPVAAPAVAVAPVAFNQCKACHSVEPGKNGIGPSLAGIYGEKAAEVPGFEFSDAMKNSGLKWDAATLDTYLTDPRKLVPGTKMSFGGLKDAAKRKEVVEYLKTL